MSERERMPTDRYGITRKGAACGFEYYVTVNAYPDGRPGEVFVKVAKSGTELSGWVNAWATTLSIALQYGVPWSILRDKYMGQRFGMGDAINPSLLHGISRSVDEIVAEFSRKQRDFR